MRWYKFYTPTKFGDKLVAEGKFTDQEVIDYFEHCAHIEKDKIGVSGIVTFWKRP